MTVVLVLWHPIQSNFYRLFSGRNQIRNTRYARYLKILLLELFLSLEKVNTEPLHFIYNNFKAPHSFQTQQNRSFFCFNNDKTWARILKQNDFKESAQADAQNLIQSELEIKIWFYQTSW